jgi:hypothetical protein
MTDHEECPYNVPEKIIGIESEIKDNYTKIGNRLHELSALMQKLFMVEIRNGGGRKVTMDRQEFFQMIYDRPKESLSKGLDNVEKINKVFDFVYKIGLVVGMIYLIFGSKT